MPIRSITQQICAFLLATVLGATQDALALTPGAKAPELSLETFNDSTVAIFANRIPLFGAGVGIALFGGLLFKFLPGLIPLLSIKVVAPGITGLSSKEKEK